MNLVFPPSLGVITESPNPTPQDEPDSLESSIHSLGHAPPKRAESVTSMAAETFDVNGAYIRALNDEQVGS
jgi:hypothetical protein